MSNRSSRSGKKIFKSTFTYFIPAPTQRKSGYREIEIDKIMRGLLNSGFDLESIQTQSTNDGLFIMAVLKTTNKKIYEEDSKQDLHEKFKLSHSHSSPDIILEEGEDA